MASSEMGSLVVWSCIVLLLRVSKIDGCRISEFYCDNGECVGLDKYCDGRKDCQDGSDEAPFCTRCNRTYYGDRQKTYHIEITKPRPTTKLPFVCALTFMAGGGDLGDIVELSFEQFQVGELVSAPAGDGDDNSDDAGRGGGGGCVGGYMKILERNIQQSTAGGWCGSAVSIPVYYSETNNVTVLLTVLTRDDDHRVGRGRGVGGVSGSSGGGSSTSSSTSGDNRFKFSLKFRYLSKQDAVTRYGPSYAQYHRGEWIPSSICDRSFQDCDSQPCKVHSPNYPGLYPRNVTCLFHITQRTIPRGKHAFVVVHQRNEDNLGVKAEKSLEEITFRLDKKLLFGDACSHDFIQIYDGADTSSSPILAKFCRSGALTPIVSSGPEMVIEFHTTAYDLLDMYRFELDVDVLFFPENDVGLRMVGQKCEWTIYADENRSGMIHSLRHVAAPNTTCSYVFNGRKDDVVWVYFVKQFVDYKGGPEPYDRQRSIVGELYDGNPIQQQLGLSRNNVTLLATFDDENKVKLCVHARNFPEFVPFRPCKIPEESYLSTGPEMFLRYNFSHQFNLHYLRMEARYEFVDTFQSGEPLASLASSVTSSSASVASSTSSSSSPSPLDGICNRVFRSRVFPEGGFTSPKNVFFFGRGGRRRSLRCTYTFIGTEFEIIRFTFLKIRLGNRKCDTVRDKLSKRYTCHRPHHRHHLRVDNNNNRKDGNEDDDNGVEVAEVKISQVLHGRVEIPMACLCLIKDDEQITVELMANVAHVNFTVTGMTSLEDFNSFFFEASYQFLSNTHCNSSNVLDGDGGEISIVATNGDILFDGPTKLDCPWLIQDDFDKFVQLKIPGALPNEVCKTTNRIMVFTTDDDLEPLAIVCPAALQENGHFSGSASDGGTSSSSSSSSSSSRGTSNAGGTSPGSSRSSSTSPANGAGGGGKAGSGHHIPSGEIEVFTKAWNKTNLPGRRVVHSSTLVVEFHAKEPGRFYFKWAKILKPRNGKLLGRKSRSEECISKCPDGSTSCVGSSSGGSGSGGDSGKNLWCDTKLQCSPNGNNIGGTDHCVSPAQFPWLYVGIGIGCGILVTMILVASLLHRRRETKAKKGKPVPTDDYPMDGKEIDC